LVRENRANRGDDGSDHRDLANKTAFITITVVAVPTLGGVL
jgi:hypothetical protein